MIAMMRTRVARVEQYVIKLDNPEVAVRDEFEVIAKSEFMSSVK